ncbi:hypothetical protein AB6D81_02025 [Vibrio splendidus]
MTYEKIAWVAAINIMSLICVFFCGLFILSQIQKSSHKLIINIAGFRGMLMVACPGVVVHEGSHYVLCRVFSHEVIRVSFFELDLTSRSLGYVKYSYNPYNLYHQLGRFFIGIAPLFGGSLAIYLLVNYFLSPGLANPFEPSDNYHFNMATSLLDNITTNIDFFANTTISIMFGLWEFIIRSPLFGLLLSYFMFSIALHAAPSRSDWHGALGGGATVVLFAFILNTVALYFSSYYQERQVTYLFENFKVWIVYAEVIVINLIFFILALSIIGFGILLIVSFFILVIRKIIRWNE